MRTSSRMENTRRNIVWAAVGKAVTVLGPFIVRAVLIRRLGAEYVGISSLYNSILQFLSLAELGFSSAVVFGMYKSIAEGDVKGVAAYLYYFRRVYRVVGLCILAMGLILVPFLNYIIKGSTPPDVDIHVAFLIYLVNSSVSYLLFAYKQSLLLAYQRSDLISRVAIVMSALQCVMQVTVLLVWPNYYAFSLVLPLCTVLSNLLVEGVVRHVMPEFSDRSLRHERITQESKRNMRKRIAGLFVSRLCNVSRNSLDSIVVSAFVGLTAVAAYTNYLTILIGLQGVLGIVGSSMTAAVGNSIVSESKEKNFSDLRVFVILYAIISIVCTSCMLVCYQPFIKIWVGDELVLPIEVPFLMVTYFYVLTMGDMRAVYADAAGIWWEQRWRSVAEAFVNVALNVVLVQLMGLPGVILATLLSLFFINFIYGSHLVFRHYFGMEKAWRYYADHALYAVVAIIASLASWWAAGFVPGDGVVTLLAKAAIAVIVSASTTVVILRRTPMFGKAIVFARRILVR